jgi:Fe-S-cluster containining protein
VTAQVVVRPVVRSFSIGRAREAAAFVRSGGQVVLWDTPTRARLVVQVPDRSNPTDFGEWAILDLGKFRHEVVRRGVLKGLATSLVPRDCNGIVRRRAERDRIHPGPTRRLLLDCLACGACCRQNKVTLERRDIERFARAHLSKLTRMPYARRQDGKLVLRLTKDRRCLHLAADNRCGIYEVRPEMCRIFPMGSECCLSARAEEFGLFDGAVPG